MGGGGQVQKAKAASEEAVKLAMAGKAMPKVIPPKLPMPVRGPAAAAEQEANRALSSASALARMGGSRLPALVQPRLQRPAPSVPGATQVSSPSVLDADIRAMNQARNYSDVISDPDRQLMAYSLKAAGQSLRRKEKSAARDAGALHSAASLMERLAKTDAALQAAVRTSKGDEQLRLASAYRDWRQRAKAAVSNLVNGIEGAADNANTLANFGRFLCEWHTKRQRLLELIPRVERDVRGHESNRRLITDGLRAGSVAMTKAAGEVAAYLRSPSRKSLESALRLIAEYNRKAGEALTYYGAALDFQGAHTRVTGKADKARATLAHYMRTTDECVKNRWMSGDEGRKVKRQLQLLHDNIREDAVESFRKRLKEYRLEDIVQKQGGGLVRSAKYWDYLLSTERSIDRLFANPAVKGTGPQQRLARMGAMHAVAWEPLLAKSIGEYYQKGYYSGVPASKADAADRERLRADIRRLIADGRLVMEEEMKGLPKHVENPGKPGGRRALSARDMARMKQAKGDALFYLNEVEAGLFKGKRTNAFSDMVAFSGLNHEADKAIAEIVSENTRKHFSGETWWDRYGRFLGDVAVIGLGVLGCALSGGTATPFIAAAEASYFASTGAMDLYAEYAMTKKVPGFFAVTGAALMAFLPASRASREFITLRRAGGLGREVRLAGVLRPGEALARTRLDAFALGVSGGAGRTVAVLGVTENVAGKYLMGSAAVGLMADPSYENVLKNLVFFGMGAAHGITHRMAQRRLAKMISVRGAAPAARKAEAPAEAPGEVHPLTKKKEPVLLTKREGPVPEYLKGFMEEYRRIQAGKAEAARLAREGPYVLTPEMRKKPVELTPEMRKKPVPLVRWTERQVREAYDKTPGVKEAYDFEVFRDARRAYERGDRSTTFGEYLREKFAPQFELTPAMAKPVPLRKAAVGGGEAAYPQAAGTKAPAPRRGETGIPASRTAPLTAEEWLRIVAAGSPARAELAKAAETYLKDLQARGIIDRPDVNFIRVQIALERAVPRMEATKRAQLEREFKGAKAQGATSASTLAEFLLERAVRARQRQLAEAGRGKAEEKPAAPARGGTAKGFGPLAEKKPAEEAAVSEAKTGEKKKKTLPFPPPLEAAREAGAPRPPATVISPAKRKQAASAGVVGDRAMVEYVSLLKSDPNLAKVYSDGARAEIRRLYGVDIANPSIQKQLATLAPKPQREAVHAALIRGARKAVYDHLGIELADLSPQQQQHLRVRYLYEHTNLFEIVTSGQFRKRAAAVLRDRSVASPQAKVMIRRMLNGYTGAYVATFETPSGTKTLFLKETSTVPDVYAMKLLKKAAATLRKAGFVVSDISAEGFASTSGAKSVYGLMSNITEAPGVEKGMSLHALEHGRDPQLASEVLAKLSGEFGRSLGQMMEVSRTFGLQDRNTSNVFVLKMKDGSLKAGFIDLDMIMTYPTMDKAEMAFQHYLRDNIGALSRATRRSFKDVQGLLMPGFMAGVADISALKASAEFRAFVAAEANAHEGKTVGWGRVPKPGYKIFPSTLNQINGEKHTVIETGPEAGRFIFNAQKGIEWFMRYIRFNAGDFWKGIFDPNLEHIMPFINVVY